MDISYTSEFDAARYGRVIGRMLGLVGYGNSPWTWGVVIAGVSQAFVRWLGGDGSGASYVGSAFLVAFPLAMGLILRLQVGRYVQAVKRMMSGGAVSECRLTDAGYEVTCEDMMQKLPWKNLAVHYHFFDDDTVVLVHSNNMPSLALYGLSRHGIARRDLEDVFRQAGLKDVFESRKLRIRRALLRIVGIVFVALAALSVAGSVASCQRSVRCFDTHVRLFDLIHGENDPRRPVFGDSLRAKVAHFLANAGEADEYLYVFVPDEEDDKVGLCARYGDWSCEAYFPCGCACSQNPGYFDHIKALHKPTVYYESEKAAWLEKIRPIAKDLYESEDEDDDKEI